MKFILSGLNADAAEEGIRGGLARYFSVTGVSLVREGNADEPWAVVECADSYEHVWNVINRLQGVYHRGKALRFYIPAHQSHDHVFEGGERLDLD
ncbi:hypothetical protein [Derxia gummosa]|uniref:Uncharacterized protein n=1 Tax=Derxia gummosa DSM 723 TaxID=1121388 RepID=A0A8B6X2N2_9BURK|nr:hypothetical protein [Derxia gummosa]